MKNYPQIMSRLFGQPLMIARHNLDAILAALGPRINIEAPELKAELVQGKQSEYGYTVLPNGNAIIPIHGSLVQRGGWLDALCGLTSYELIATQFEAALEDPAVKRIVLDLDSPGGEVSGAFDLSDRIYSARGQKRIVGVSNEMAYSAGYLLISACDEVIVNRTAGVGSIGVIALHVDQSKAEEKAGFKVTHIFAGERKADMSPHQPLSDEAFAWAQEQVNETYDLFVKTVARNRGLSEESVRGTKAGLFIGKSAVKAGLADRIDTMANVLAEQPKGELSMNKTKAAATAPKQGAEAAQPQTEPTENTPPQAAEEEATEQPQTAAGSEEGASAATSGAADENAAAASPAGDPPAQDKPNAAADPLAVAAEVATLCAEAGVPAMAASLIREGVSVEQAKERVNAAAQIREACRIAKMPSKAEGFIAAGMSLTDVRAALFDAMVKADLKIDSHVGPDAVAQPDRVHIQSSWDQAFAKARV